ncbi:MAG TPA: peptidylprolyl isomerase [Candidatus Thermoplasmatota archaeon]|nr:peptidylprolyl isomerase [Candidatus Thermoplasmatota archaeon]
MKQLLAVALLLATALAGCGDSTDTTTTATTTGADGSSDPCAAITRASLSPTPAANQTVVTLSTDKGCIVALLEDQKAPLTVANFKRYASESFFDNTLFHRIIKDFMVQTGGMGTDGQFKTPTHAAIKNEARASGLKNLAYTLSMARGSAADSATNQFFINHHDNAFLDPSGSSAGYAVFGHVVKGNDVVDAIASVPVEAYNSSKHCQPGDAQPSCPTHDVVLRAVRVLA